jgi:hypothetical protein
MPHVTVSLDLPEHCQAPVRSDERSRMALHGIRAGVPQATVTASARDPVAKPVAGDTAGSPASTGVPRTPHTLGSAVELR